MSVYLSAAWLDAEPRDPLAEAAAAAGLEVRLARAIAGGPDGEVRYTARVSGGSVAYERGLAADAEVTLTDTAANARAMVRGELDPNAAFMRGQTKVQGATGPLLAVLAETRGEAYRGACAALAATLDS